MRVPPISPPSAAGPRGQDLPAYLSNGLIGLRLREVPLVAGICVVNGTVGVHPEKRLEAVVPIPYPFAADISVGEARLAEQPWVVDEISQDYDFQSGELTSRFNCTLSGTRLHVEVLTFCSRSHPTIACQEVHIEGPEGAEIGFCSQVDTAGVRGNVAGRKIAVPGEPDAPIDGVIQWVTEGALSTCGVAVHAGALPEQRKTRCRPFDAGGPVETRFAVCLPAGGVRIRQLASLVPSLLHGRPEQEAVRKLAEAQRLGFDELRRRNRSCWRELWKGRPVINDGRFEHQDLVDAAYYYLNASVHEASPSATAIFGMAYWPNYHYYYGHVMWDIDAFCVPPLILSQPEAARGLLDFRQRSVPAARRNAKLFGKRGLQFPWEAGAITGEEAAPGSGSAAAHEIHVSMHVARAFSMLGDCTGEDHYLADSAWPVLSGVADWICDRVDWTGGAAHFRAAGGIAEVPDPPDDDTFTIIAARQVLARAVDLAARLGRTAPDLWAKTASALHPIVRSDGALAAHADFRIDEPKGTTPSPLAALFPYDYEPGDARERATLELYLSRWKDYVGSPMLPAFYPLWAARLGDRKLAARLFEEGFAAYDHPRFHQCLEYRLDHPDSKVPAGPFFANIGALLSSLMLGFPALVIDGGDPQTWPRRPVVLPQGWDSIEFDRLSIRGRPARLVARHGAERAELTL